MKFVGFRKINQIIIQKHDLTVVYEIFQLLINPFCKNMDKNWLFFLDAQKNEG